MNPKLAFILIDGMNKKVAQEQLTVLEHAVKTKKATKFLVESILPSSSRPVYATIGTGLLPTEHGIGSNGCNKEKLPFEI